MSTSLTKPNLPSLTRSEAARNQIGIMRKKFKASEEERLKKTKPTGNNLSYSYSGDDFERDFSQMLSYWLPHCALSSIPLFSPSSRRANESGYEIDTLLHLRYEAIDYIIAIETKAQSIKVDNDRWNANYGDGDKCAKQQVDSHLSALREYLEPISRHIEAKFIGFVVTPDDNTKTQRDVGKRNSELILCSVAEFFRSLEKRFNLNQKPDIFLPEVFRVTQSPFLDLLRLSNPLDSLGHPELGGALRYVERCRRTLDQTLFHDFSPKSERWLINGSAGMGKSVLLAYTAVVLASGYKLVGSLDEIGTYKANDILEVFNFKNGEDSIAIVAMSQRQLQNLKMWFDFFVDRFQKTEGGSRLHFYRPDFYLTGEIQVWGNQKKSYKAVLLDEAHDMQSLHEFELYKAYQKDPFYLVAACDRFQKLRLTNDSARVLKNFSFTGKSTRLKHVYRNPSPIYIASLALMFRWFAIDGPKVIPRDVELRDSYGFDVFSNGKEKTLTLQNDAHPANYWAHCVSMFPDVSVVYNLIRRERLKREDVLWVRFCDENVSFDYEALHDDVTYHNGRTRDFHKLCDKYIKGQDFPIVVIEGFPSFMDEYDTEEKEKHMWQFRRELYLCASRATCFLYFVFDVTQSVVLERIEEEFSSLFAALGNPKFETKTAGSRKWQVKFQTSQTIRDHSVFSADELENPVHDDRESNEFQPTIQAETHGLSIEKESIDLTRLPKPASMVVEVQEEILVHDIPRAASVSSHMLTNENPSVTGVTDTDPVDTAEFEITIPEPMSAKEFSDFMEVPLHLVGRELLKLKAFKNSNALIPVEILSKIAPKFGCQVVDQISAEQESEDN
jgi:hypothetical protein